ncbi:MAG TPA: carbohydrate kinase family protein [Anaerolineales bacterium]|nr:carbohydrate kinase family protein [Anaerolineales bacterium]
MKSVQKPGKYLLIGDLCVDIFMQVAAYPAAGGDGTVQAMHQHAGGSAANTAMMLANLGGEPTLLTHTGTDVWAQELLPILDAAGVRVDRIVQDETDQTGLTFLVVSSDAERTMFTYRGANRNLHPDEIIPGTFRNIDCLHISSYACLTPPQSNAVLKAVEFANQHNVKISLDIGVEPASLGRETIWKMLPVMSLIVLGEPEALVITQESTLSTAISTLVHSGVQIIALKLGKDGCRLIRKDQDVSLAGFPIDAVDTTGAGDAFSAGMIHGLTHGWPLEMAGRFANALGALAAIRWGAGEALPSLKEVNTFLSVTNSMENDPDISNLMEELEKET